MSSIQKSHYEELLAAYCQAEAVIGLLRNYRTYLEMLPSTRRPEESLITLPLPLIRIRQTVPAASGHGNFTASESLLLPCEIAILMCDPEWKIKTGAEIFIFIHRPEEDFSDLLGRWRRTQVLLGREYEWVLPPRYQHLLGEGVEKIYPLFVLFENTPQRIKRGLKGAALPFVTQTLIVSEEPPQIDELFEALGVEDD
jgi:hypothetical protein